MDVFKAIKVGDDFCTRLIDILVNQLTPKFKELEQLQLLSTPNAQVVLEAKRKEIVPLIKTTTRLEKGLDRVLIIVVKAINQVNQDLQEEEYGSIHNDDTTIGICKSLLIKALSKRGELEQAFERRHYQDCLATIQRVVSKWPTPGILTLQAELRELEFAVDTDQLVETDGFTLPPGYSLASDWMVRHGRREPPRSIIRWLTCDTKGKNISRLLIFNNINPHYHAFLEQCKKDSLALAKALQAEFRKRNVPIWCKGGRETGKYDSIRFLIRPLFTKSELNDKEKAGTRQDWKTEEKGEFKQFGIGLLKASEI